MVCFRPSRWCRPVFCFFLIIREREKKEGQGGLEMFIPFPYLVHSSEICHVVDKDVYFDDIVDIGSSSFENCCEILDGLMLFFFSAIGHQCDENLP